MTHDILIKDGQVVDGTGSDAKYADVAIKDGIIAEIGKIDGHQKRIGAKVVGFPFYDPTKSRVRS